MNSYKKTVIITTLITLLPILAGVILWSRLPDKIPMHWNFSGEADGWSGKSFAVFGFPCILAVIHLIAVLVTFNDPKRKNIHKKPLTFVVWLTPVLSVLLNGVTYAIALGADIDMSVIVFLLVGIFFILIGNYMPKLQQNYTVGIKIPWTLNSVENWNRTHRLGGKLFIVGGFVIIVNGFIGGFAGETLSLAVMIAVVVLCAVIPMGYSFWLFHRGI